MKPRGKFVPFTEIAEKWGYPEDELIQLAIQMEQFNLYCLKPIPGNPARMPFFIGDELNDFLPGKPSISCSQFGFKTSDYEEGTFIRLGPEERKFAAMHRAGRPEFYPTKVTIYRAELYLHRDEIADMEARHPELTGAKAVIETDANSQSPKSAKQSDTRKETSSIRIIDEPIDILLSQDNSELVSLSYHDSKTVATLESRLPLPQEIEKESDLIDQAEKPDAIKKPPKKKVKASQRLIGGDAEPLLLSKDDREPLPFKTFADLQNRTLSLDDIIGNREKGIPAIIPVSRSTWYAGVKSGRYPKSFQVSENRVAWKGCEIYTLLQEMGLV